MAEALVDSEVYEVGEKGRVKNCVDSVEEKFPVLGFGFLPNLLVGVSGVEAFLNKGRDSFQGVSYEIAYESGQTRRKWN